MVASNALSLLLLLVLGVAGMPLPVGMPPLPEDPALLRAASKDSIAYVQWAGTGAPAPGSKNLTERMVAEPEVRALVERLLTAARASIRAELPGDHRAAMAGLDLGLALMSRPGCVFLSEIDMRRQSFAGGIVVRVGADGRDLLAKLNAIEPRLLESATEVEIGGATLHSPRLSPRAPRVVYGLVGDYMIAAVGGDGTAEQIVAGLRGESDGLGGNATFNKLHAAVKVARPGFRAWIDTAALIEKFAPMLGPDGGRVLDGLGLSGVRGIVSESGLEGDGYAARTVVSMPERKGMFGLLGDRPLALADLEMVPADATFAVALRASPADVWSGILEITGAVEPRARAQMEREVERDMERYVGLKLHDDLLAHCGDTLTVWNSPKQGGLLFTGLVAALSLNDARAFGDGFAKLMAQAKTELAPRDRGRGRMSRGIRVEELDFEGRRIWWLNTIGDDDVPFAPAFCVTDTHLLFSLFPQMLKSTIRRGAVQPDSLALQQKVRLSPRAVAMTYVDTRQLFELGYPALHLAAQMICSELQQDGFSIDVSALPSAEAIRPHVRSDTMLLEHHELGLRIARRGTVPFADPLIGGVVPMAFGMFSYRAASSRAVMVEARMVEAARAADAERAAEMEARRAAIAAESAAIEKALAAAEKDLAAAREAGEDARITALTKKIETLRAKLAAMRRARK